MVMHPDGSELTSLTDNPWEGCHASLGPAPERIAPAEQMNVRVAPREMGAPRGSRSNSGTVQG